MSLFTSIDLFAGIGGFRLAVEANGGKCIGYSEIFPDAIETYERNYPQSRESNFGDITRIKDLPKHDFLTGGVPCQSWSIAGMNLGFDDDRGQLWNDAIYLLNRTRPKAFMFENVKGLVDPRNKKALDYILMRIKDAGYFAGYYVLNSFDYGVPQSRVRIYIIGFREKKFFDAFKLPSKSTGEVKLYDILDDFVGGLRSNGVVKKIVANGREANRRNAGATSLSTNNNGYNDYFLLNDIRNGDTTIHSWDIIDTTQRERDICLLLLKNRRRSEFGPLDGNPLSLQNFQALDSTISQKDIDILCEKGILQAETYRYRIVADSEWLTDDEKTLLSFAQGGILTPDCLSAERRLKKAKIKIKRTLAALLLKKIVAVEEVRYDFKNTKISAGLFGVSRIFLPTSNIFPTLVASDSNDYVTTVVIPAQDKESYRTQFLQRVYFAKRYRQITKQEACRIQGFPVEFKLPDNRARWMHLVGNSVSVPVVTQLVKAICKTGVFANASTIEIGKTESSAGECQTAKVCIVESHQEQLLLAVERKKAKTTARQRANGLKGAKIVAKRKRK